MISCAYVFAPPGVDLGKVEEKLKRQYGNHIDIQDIEEELKDRQETKDALRDVGAPYQSFRMYEVTWYLPRSKVRALWRQAASQCLGKLVRSSKTIRVLCGHLLYYCGQRSEFYSPVDFNLLISRSDLKPSHIVLLIDDVYDMYYRLTRKDELFDHAERIPVYLERLCYEQGINIEELSPEQLLSYCMGWELRTITHLLSWGHFETIFIENLSAQV
ncbi:hypothetical protein HKBW3S42_01383, partial [Candidatus Hakubella thermalkaliphila]